MALLFQNEYASINIYPEKEIIHHTIYKHLPSEEFREFLTVSVQLFLDYNCTKWLSDDRLSNIIDVDDMEWAKELWLDKVIPGGWLYWAIIPPDVIKGQINTQFMTSGFRAMGVITEVFHNVESAMKWLESR